MKKSEMNSLAKERKIIFFIIFIAIAAAFFLLSSLSLASAAGEVNYCCEKTVDGRWCQNAPQNQCDASFKTAPTSCESTSYCKPGCCFNEQEGICMESTPQKVCAESNGIWANDEQCQIPQCSLGCCILGDQGAFVTLTRCKTLSGFYQLKTDFRRTITSELACIQTAQKADKGACVTEDAAAGVKNCVFTTRDKCSTGSLSTDNVNLSTMNATDNKTVAPVGFYKDILCSAPELGAICGKSTKTTLIDGKDEVYFTDTCGNIANIYDASKWNDNKYWRNAVKKADSCGSGSSNAGSKTCGNCDYFKGSIGRKASTKTGFPQIGDNICIDLSCKKEGKKHGESWCNNDDPTGNGQDTVGSRYYKEVCLFDEILSEPCADFRGETCIEQTFNGFSEAACRPNRWQDCMKQKDEDACTNIDVRDCLWQEGMYFSTTTGQIEKSNNDTEKGDLTPKGICLPNVPPGLTFWGSQSTTTSGGLNTPAAAGTAGKNGSFSSTTPAFEGTTPAFGTGYVDPSTAGGASAEAQCAMANAKISFKWQQVTHPASLGILGLPDKEDEWTCADGAEGDSCRIYIASSEWKQAQITKGAINSWSDKMNKICGLMGDCGGKSNFLGVATTDGYATYQGQKRVAGSGGSEIIEKTKKATTGGTTTGGTAGTTNTGGTAANSNSNLADGAKAASSLLGFSLPIQGYVIKDYFKNLFGGKN